MIVAVDAQLAVGTATGIGEYARGLIDALRAQGREIRELAEPALDPWRFDRRVLWDQVLLPQRARRSGADLLHCASGTMPLLLPLPAVVTVHDVAWLRVQAHAKAYARGYFGAFSVRQYRRARAVIVDSQFSRAELLDALDLPAERVHVVYPGVAADFCAVRRESANGEPLILVPGTVERRKNLEVLVRALVAIPGARLVSVGPPTPYRDECLALARRVGVADRFEARGYVARAELLALYARCSVVAVPSRYEGFGYAAAQALCAGAPVVLSDRSSLPEIAGGDARVVPVDDVAAWSRALTETIADPSSQASADRARLRARERFAWPASARAMGRIYDGVTGALNRRG
ncbi:MAG TPA: glycosyltransferase family 1 protein [Candidatus Baltobacteraceae bacterium]